MARGSGTTSRDTHTLSLIGVPHEELTLLQRINLLNKEEWTPEVQYVPSVARIMPSIQSWSAPFTNSALDAMVQDVMASITAILAMHQKKNKTQGML